MYLLTYTSGGGEVTIPVTLDEISDKLVDFHAELELMRDGDFFMVRKANYLDTKQEQPVGLRLIQGGKNG